MKKSLFYIAILLYAFSYSTAQAISNHNKRLDALKVLINNGLDFSNNVTRDSIISWEKELMPELENEPNKELLFQIKLLAIKAELQKGNISLALDKANTIYQRAKQMNYPFGIALSLKAIGEVSLVSSNPQITIESYEEALKILQKENRNMNEIIITLYRLICIKISYRSTDMRTFYTSHKQNDLALLDKFQCIMTEDDVLPLIKELEKTASLNSNDPTNFYIPMCYAYYYIQTPHPENAKPYLEKCQIVYQKHPFLYFKFLNDYLYTQYHISTKEYGKAIKQYEQLLNHIDPSNSYMYLELLKEQADLLTTIGDFQKAINSYELINEIKDSINIQSYLIQINELHALYQIDKKELDNELKQKRKLITSMVIGGSLLLILIQLIILIRKSNRKLLHSKEKQEKAKLQAEKSIRTKSLFLSNMSHEIRTPLNALNGFAQILTEESIDNETRQQCNDIILQNSELLLKLIDDVVDLSNLEIRQIAFHFKQCDAVAICQNVIGMMNKIKQTQAELVFECAMEKLYLETDEGRLQQILINLLINATKFTPRGSITLALTQTTNYEVIFSVTDTGCGIPLDKQPFIFNRFEKLNENIQGTGLGLSICELIITQIGGRIWIDETYTSGARFIFTHPIKHTRKRKDDLS